MNEPYYINDINYLLPMNKGGASFSSVIKQKYKNEPSISSHINESSDEVKTLPIPSEIKNDSKKMSIWNRIKNYDYSRLQKLAMATGASALVAGLVLLAMKKNQDNNINDIIDDFNNVFGRFQMDQRNILSRDALLPRPTIEPFSGNKFRLGSGYCGGTRKAFIQTGQKKTRPEMIYKYSPIEILKPIDPSKIKVDIKNPDPIDEKKINDVWNKIKKMPWKEVLLTAGGVGLSALLARKLIMSSPEPPASELVGMPELIDDDEDLKRSRGEYQSEFLRRISDEVNRYNPKLPNESKYNDEVKDEEQDYNKPLLEPVKLGTRFYIHNIRGPDEPDMFDENPYLYVGNNNELIDIRDSPDIIGFGKDIKGGNLFKTTFNKLKNMDKSTLKKIALGVGIASVIASSLLKDRQPQQQELFRGYPFE